MCANTINSCVQCDYFPASGILNCTTCADGYNSVTANGYDFCRNSQTSKSGCVEGSEFCSLCAYGFVDLYNSGECHSCKSRIPKCLQCIQSRVPGAISVLLCEICAPGYVLNDYKISCIEENCEVEHCLECEDGGECGECLPGYMLEDNICKLCSDLTFAGCEACKAKEGGYICTACKSTNYGEQRQTPQTEEVQCIFCSSLSSGCQVCLLDSAGSMTQCLVCYEGFSKGGPTDCLDCSQFQSECLMCESKIGDLNPDNCLMCSENYELKLSGTVYYCREKTCNADNCITCEGEQCTKCFGTTFLTPDNSLCYNAELCSKFSLKLESTNWKLDECYTCPSNMIYNGTICINCYVDHCVSTACQKLETNSYCGLCQDNYIPLISSTDLLDSPNPINYPYYLGTSCVLKVNCNYIYSTQFTDTCIQGTYIIYIYIYILFIENACPSKFEEQAINGEPGKFKCIRESRKAVIYVSNIYSNNMNPAYFNTKDSDSWVGDVTKPIYNLFLGYMKVFIYI